MTLIHPVLFSSYFKVPANALAKAGLLDPILNSDTKLFIDPLLIAKSRNPIIAKVGKKALNKAFKDIVDLVSISAKENDAAWKAAVKTLNLDERAETGLGYGGASTSGSSRPLKLRNSIIGTAKEIVTLGEKDPSMIPLMSLFEEGVGPDTLSDLASNLLLPALCEITEGFCEAQGIPVKKFPAQYASRSLPVNPYRPDQPVLLVPRDVLRDLPLAADWSDVSRVVFENREIRDAVNRMVGGLTKATVSERKRALRKVSLSSLENVRRVIEAVANASDSYDEAADLDGFYLFRDVLTGDRKPYIGLIKKSAKRDAAALRDTVVEIIDQFTDLLENNNLWELLWNQRTPRHERAAQLLFFAVATVMCAVNEVDISPETNSGGGPVDFKFSTGSRSRVLVEIKLSSGSVVHGYKKQLEIYKKANKADYGILLVIDVGKLGRKMTDIEKIRDKAVAAGERASQIFYADGRRQVSASKA